MRYTFTLLILCMAGLLSAQAEISATIVDSTGTTLPGANAILLRTSDTLLTSFGTTDDKGTFLMTKVPAGEYILRVSFLGYERPDQPLTVTESDQYLGLGELKMYPAGFMLSGVEVTADRIPIRMKGDTMLYDAEAFAVGENAKVEDLLRRLPGMSIDANGQLTWRGKPVQEVMINGKPFFAGNSSLITQNLDAKALKNVEVFDQKSDSEEITGIDDGEENTTVNLEMKEEFKAKVFGELYAGGGTQERYDGGGKLFRISDLSQIGVLGTINNVNRVGFTGDELLSFNQSSGRGSFYTTGGSGNLPYYDGGQTPGQNRSIAAGINFGRSIGKEGQLTMDYTLFDRQQQQIVTERQAFTRTGQERQTETLQNDASNNYSHRLGFRFEQELDTTSRLTLSGSGYMTGNDNLGVARTIIEDQDGNTNEYTVDESSDGESPGGDFSVRYNRRIGSERGRTFGANANVNYRENLSDLQILTEGLNDDLAIPGALINGLQFQDRNTTSFNLGGEVEYNEPLTEKLIWETGAEYGIDDDEGDFRFRLNEQRVENLLTRRWTTASGGTGLVYRYGKGNNLRLSAKYLSGELMLEGDANRATRFNYFLPSLGYRIRSGKGFYNIRYSANAQAPSITQLQTIARPSVTGRVSVGNLNLEPAVRHNANASVWFNDQFRALSANAYVNVSYTDNAFGNSLTFTPGQQIYKTVNVSHAWSSNVYLGTTVGMAFINGELRLNANGGNSIGQGFVDGEARTNTTTNYSGGGEITTEFNEETFLKLGYTYARNGNKFDDERSDEIVTITHDLLSQFELEVSPKWRLETRFLYRIFEAAAFAGANNIPDLQADLEVRPFKTAGHYFRISARDLLNQNTVITRQAQPFVTSERISDGLGRYFLMTFHYKL